MTITPALARRLGVAALVLCAIAAALIGALLLTAARQQPAQAAQPAPTATATVTATPAPTPVAPIVTALVGPATDLPPAQAEQLSYAADRVCEGMTDGVPLMTIADSFVTDLGLTDTEAHDLTLLAATTHCAA